MQQHREQRGKTHHAATAGSSTDQTYVENLQISVGGGGGGQGWVMGDTSELTTFLFPQSGLKGGRQKNRSLHHRRDSPLI